MEAFRKTALCIIMILMVTTLRTECRDPVLHRVGGGKYTWAPKFNFTEWSSHQHFYVGDWLYFGFDKHWYNVLQVNKTSYDKCIGTDFIQNVTRGGRDVFNLTEEQPYYFICSRGDYCFKGMKVTVYVENDPPYHSPNLITSAPASAFASPPSTYALFMLPSALLMMFFSYI